MYAGQDDIVRHSRTFGGSCSEEETDELRAALVSRRLRYGETDYEPSKR